MWAWANRTGGVVNPAGDCDVFPEMFHVEHVAGVPGTGTGMFHVEHRRIWGRR